MAIKRILVPLPDSADHAGEIDMALSAAELLEAHVEALFITQPPPPLPPGVEGIPSRYVQEPAHWRTEEVERRPREAREAFARACAVRQVRLLDVNEAPESPPTALWRQAEGTYESIAVKRSAAFDLVVATSAAVMQSLRDIAESSLLQTRRPVLLAPLRVVGSLTDPAMIAWNESPECWHAVSAAIPFLKHAKAVEVVSVDKNVDKADTSRRESQEELFAYLRCHGISATSHVVARQSRSVGETLLNEAVEAGAGLLVMGAYSHSRLREMLLGGVTRHVLTNATATPVLMAH